MKARKLIVCIIVVLVYSFSAISVNAQNEEKKWTVIDNTKICLLCGESVNFSYKYCTNCGEEVIIMSPGITIYTFMFSDILKKYNLKIEQKNRGWMGASLQKITREKVLELQRLAKITREYCNLEGSGFKEILSSGEVCTGKYYLGAPVTKHYTEILY